MLFVVSNNIAAWDVLKAKELIIRKDIGKVNSITVSTVNEMFATAHKDASVKVWNQINGSLALCLEGHLNEVGDIVICEKHKLLIFIKLDTLYAWNYDNQQMAYVIMNNKPIKTMIISHNQEYLLISSHQNRADILSIKDGILKSTIVDNECGFEMFEMSYDGNHAVTVSNEGKIIIWNVKTGKPFKYLANKAREPICLKMVEHNQTVFTIGKNGQIEKWDYNNTVCIYRKKYCNECIIVDADFCEKISRAIAVTSEGKAILIDTEDGSIVSSICMKPSIALDSCRFKTEFSPNEETFLLYDGFTIQIFDSLSGEEIKQNGVKLKQNIIGFNCYFTPRGNHIICKLQ